MTLYIVAIGGTGARCVEAILHLSASGLFNSSAIKILFVDPDASNGNLSRTRDTLNRYQDCRRVLDGESDPIDWMKTPIIDLGLWSPFDGTMKRNLNDFFNYNSYRQHNSNLGHLMDVLYTQDERKLTLDVGFHGRPAIGAAILSQLGQEIWEQPAWKALIDSLKQDWNNEPRIFLVGSIFGGTGAAGFPTISRLIARKLVELGKRRSVKLGGVLMLPYFQFAEPDALTDIYARSDEFLLNTEAALRYYTSQQAEVDNQLIPDVTYLLGAPDLLSVQYSSVGRNSQCNQPHFVELYAALAARHFLQDTPQQQVVLISRESPDQLTWADIPDRQIVKPALVNLTRFAFAWLTGIIPALNEASKESIQQFQIAFPWFSEFFQPRRGFLDRILIRERDDRPELTDAQQQAAIITISRWCETYLTWLTAIHASVSRIELFHDQFIKARDPESLPKLVVEPTTEEQLQTDTIQHLQENLKADAMAPVGSVGLARSLYTLCKPGFGTS